MTEGVDEFARLQLALAGTWSVERELGTGGMGRVYLARDVRLDRPVALKVLRPDLAADAESRARFLREARTGARLAHPNIVPIYAVEEREGLVFFVMGLVDGETLGARIRREGPLDCATAERFLRDMAWALGYAHAMGIVHRDVTLENMLLERSTGRCLLADFGIAAEIEASAAGPLLGTPAYLAPEVIQGQPATTRSDLYALAVAGWTMLTGRPPFLADDTPALLMQHLTEPAPPLDRAAPATPRRLAAAIMTGLAKDPAARPGNMEEWLGSIQEQGSGHQLARPLRRWITRGALIRPAYAIGMTITAMVTLEAAIGWYGAVPSFLSARLAWRMLLGWSADVIHGFVAVACIVVLCHLVTEFVMLRRLARNGYGIEDLRHAQAQRRAEAVHAGPVEPTLLGRVVNDLAWLAGITFLLILLIFMPSHRLFMTGGEMSTIREVQQLLLTLAQWSYVAFWTGLGFGFLVPATRTAPDGWLARTRERFWASRLGAAMLRIASVGLPRYLPAAETLHRPTELVLDLAIDDLWKALPATTRQGLDHLPGVVDRLRQRVGELRDLERMLAKPAHVRSAEARALRERLAQRQRDGLAALEQLRLLVGALGHAASPMGVMTAHLAQARDLEEDLLRELGTHAALRRALRRGRQLPGMSAEPTPA